MKLQTLALKTLCQYYSLKLQKVRFPNGKCFVQNMGFLLKEGSIRKTL